MGELASFAVPGLFPEIEPRASGMLRVDPVHSMYWEESGDPAGVPAVFLHGARAREAHRSTAVFDPARIASSCTTSAGRGALPRSGNCATTPRRIWSPIWRLCACACAWNAGCVRGSWGSTLALAYAEAHPERCLALILRGIFLCRRSEIDWFLYGLRGCFLSLGRNSRLPPPGGAQRSAPQLPPPVDRPRPGDPHACCARVERLRGILLDSASQPRDRGVFCRGRRRPGSCADRGALFS